MILKVRPPEQNLEAVQPRNAPADDESSWSIVAESNHRGKSIWTVLCPDERRGQTYSDEEFKEKFEIVE